MAGTSIRRAVSGPVSDIHSHVQMADQGPSIPNHIPNFSVASDAQWYVALCGLPFANLLPAVDPIHHSHHSLRYYAALDQENRD